MNKLSQFHDAEIVGVRINGDQFDIEVKNSQSQVITLDDVFLVRVEDFLKRNVISVAWVLGPETERERVVSAIRSTCTLADGTELLNLEAFERTVDEVMLGDLIVFELEPSWGASLFAICRSMRIDGIPIER